MSQTTNPEKLIGFVGGELHKDLNRRVGQKDKSNQTDFELSDSVEFNTSKRVKRSRSIN